MARKEWYDPKKPKVKAGTGLSFNLVEAMQGDDWFANSELIVERKSGKVRQAGASQAHGKFIDLFKRSCELDLYCFLRGVMGHWFLDKNLHKPVADWLTTFPPYRKMILMPRNHGKTCMVAQGIPLHAMIQPKATNIYFKNQPGSHLKLVLAGETEEMAVRNLRVIKTVLEGNVLFRALWPHLVYENPRRQAPKWSDDQIIIPRDRNFPEPTVRALGVGGAVTGMHPNMLIKDDLTTQRAANEPATMGKTIEWHTDSRALFAEAETDIEFITGTYWANYDLPHFIEENDPTVQVNTEWRRMVDYDGNILWPGKFGFKGAVEQLQKEHGIKFPLLYLNESQGEGLTEFFMSDVRDYELRGGAIHFDENDLDVALTNAINRPEDAEPPPQRGMDFYTHLSVNNLDYLRNTRGG